VIAQMRADDSRSAELRARRGRDEAIIDLDRIDALLFDLDGVVTKTAAVHAAAWKRLFDELLERRSQGRPWQPFDADREYRQYVDGKPRREVCAAFSPPAGSFCLKAVPTMGPERRRSTDLRLARTVTSALTSRPRASRYTRTQ
jgi:trehalose 6-phosphate phosphatase